MANNYSQFSECIDNITPEEAAWINRVLHLDGIDDYDELVKELSYTGTLEADMWPHFDWKLEDDGTLWLYADEGFTDEHLCVFVREFICRFRPDFIFSVTGSETCSRPRIGEFGGWWLVVYKDGVEGGNTWDAAKEARERIEKELKT
jgi:hypothetical protein